MSLSALKVLIVDNQITRLRIVRNLLAQIGITAVDEAHDGHEALQKLTQGKYHLVLSEWSMVPMTGLELLQCVRSDATYKHKEVAFFLVTSNYRQEHLIAAKTAGADCYIPRPFDAKILETKIKVSIKV
ncbi:MAG: response regulator [Ferruginibacter sp.]|nr:response regulator [Ferruginibacter sp.]